jgi:hypothetical protein
MLAIKTGDYKALPHKLLYSLFVKSRPVRHFEEDLVVVSNSKQKFMFGFEIENAQTLY